MYKKMSMYIENLTDSCCLASSQPGLRRVRHSMYCRLIVSLLIVTAAITANGATFYVDAVNGNDANPGNNGQPWQTFARALPNYSGDGPVVAGGDTVYIASGNYGEVTYRGNGDTGRSSWIDYKGAAESKPILEYFRILYASNAYLRFYNIQFHEPQEDKGPYTRITDLKGQVREITDVAQSNPAVVTFATNHFYSNGDRIVINRIAGMTELNGNLFTVANKTDKTFELSGIDSSGYGSYTGGGVAEQRVSHVEFYNCYFRAQDERMESSSAFRATYADFIVWDGCEFDGGRYAVQITDDGTDFVLRNCYFNDQWGNGVYINPGTNDVPIKNVTIEGCLFDNIEAREGVTPAGEHFDQIQTGGPVPPGSQPVDNLIIRGNTVHCMWDDAWNAWDGYEAMGFQVFYLSHNGTGVVIENNLIYGTTKDGGIKFDHTIDDITIRNNTVVPEFGLGKVTRISETCSNIKFYNNIWLPTVRINANAMEVLEGNNIYADFHKLKPDSSDMDVSSREIGSAAIKALFVNAESNDFRLKSDSLAIDFANANAPTSDIAGNLRVGAPDAGCYEYISSDPGNSAPVLQAIGAKSVSENSLLSFSISATDADGDAITYSAANLPAGAAFSGQGFSWTPNDTQSGSHQVTFSASDGQVQDSEIVTITVSGINSDPVLAPVGNRSVNESGSLSFSISATDADGDTIVYSVQDLPSGAVFSGQQFTWSPGLNQAGTYQVTFVANDGQAQDSETITITVINTNMAPVLDAIGSQSIYEGSRLRFMVDATDPDGDSIVYSTIGLPSGATFSNKTFIWTPINSQTGSHNVVFIASDGQRQDTETVTIVVTGDLDAPVVPELLPEFGAMQVPVNSLITLHIADSGKGVDAGSVTVEVAGNLVYTGDTDAYNSAYGDCRRSGTQDDYTFVYQADESFRFNRRITVVVNATDLGGNALTNYSYAFKTEMHSFGQNKKVKSGAKGTLATAKDPSGDTWVAFDTETANGGDISVSRLAAGAETFDSAARVTADTFEQSDPEIAADSTGKLYVTWQDKRAGDWDVYVATSSDGINWSAGRNITDPNSNQTDPAIVIDSADKAYVVWQDDRGSNNDIYIAESSNDFLSRTTSRITSDAASQTEPAITVDSGDTVYVAWADTRNGTSDIYGADSANGPWTNVAVVSKQNKQSSPVIAAEQSGSTLHLLWTDDTMGDNDIYYASCDGLPGSPLAGSNLIDDNSGAEQLQPAISVTGSTGNNLGVFATWCDYRNADTDLYFTEINSDSGTNILVGDDMTNTNQLRPAIGTDEHGKPYLVWLDDREQVASIYFAGSTFIEPSALESVVVLGSKGATVGVKPGQIDSLDDISIIVPPRAYPSDVRVSISRMRNAHKFRSAHRGTAIELGPSGSKFSVPVTVNLPFDPSVVGESPIVYWYDPLTDTIRNDGITNVTYIPRSQTLHVVRFKVRHFTMFLLGGGGGGGIFGGGGGGGGGCSMSPDGKGSVIEFLLPYLVLAIVMTGLKVRDRRRSKIGEDAV